MSTGIIKDALDQQPTSNSLDNLTIGRVVCTNDPQGNARIRVFCPAYGDTEDKEIKDIPWAFSVSPLGGVTNYGTKGPEKSESNGAVAYGMWNVPKIGAHVLVGCVDGKSDQRFWLGCLHPKLLSHTMPHGIYLYSEDENGTPDGPIDTNEKPIEPLYGNFTKAFTSVNGSIPDTPNDPRKNFEWRTRGADTQVSALTNVLVNGEDSTGSEKADHEFGNFVFTQIVEEDNTVRQLQGIGYGVSNLEPDVVYTNTGNVNYDSHIYSWTTPGFHSISMDDRNQNCRMRFRSTAGNQIILDDTNERIYVSTAEGETWVELDQKGNIDIYGSKTISVHAQDDINFTADKTFRVKAGEGIHMYTDDEFRVHAKKDIHVKSELNIRSHSIQETFINADNNLNMYTLAEHRQFSSGVMHIQTNGSNILVESVGAQVHLNGPSATTASISNESDAFWTSRLPEHEPWARMYMKKDGAGIGADNDTNNAHTPEYSYTDALVGRISTERGVDFKRNKYWHR